MVREGNQKDRQLPVFLIAFKVQKEPENRPPAPVMHGLRYQEELDQEEQ